MKVLLTGGAGFIGTSWIKMNIERNDIEKVYIIDALLPQIHGENAQIPEILIHEKIEFVNSYLERTDKKLLSNILKECEVVIHLASETGVGQSMYELVRYTEGNVNATAALLEAIIGAWTDDVVNKRIILSSSRAVYGEGEYYCNHCQHTITAFNEGIDHWDPVCISCGKTLISIPTLPEHRTKPSSIYASTKLIQEQMIQQVALSRGFKYFNLRFFNVFGPGQAFGNPYTGILTTFLLRARAGQPLYIYEDGNQSRDFIYIDDITSAVTKAMSAKVSGTYNVATGEATSILDIAKQIAKHYQLPDNAVEITGRHRAGDIRHCTADIKSTKENLEWAPAFNLTRALENYLNWFDSQNVNAADRSEEAWNEILNKGMGKIIK